MLLQLLFCLKIFKISNLFSLNEKAASLLYWWMTIYRDIKEYYVCKSSSSAKTKRLAGLKLMMRGRGWLNKENKVVGIFI